MFVCYVLQSWKSGRFYIGHAADLEVRLREHNNGRVTATCNKGPWAVVYTERFDTRAGAAQREREIKSWKSAVRIRELIAPSVERPENREGR